MLSIVYTHPRGQAERVFLSGLGVFEHGVPREVDEATVSVLLGSLVDGRFERNGCFSVHVAPTVQAEPPAAAVEPFEDAAPVADDTLPSDAEDTVPNSVRQRRKKE